MNSYIPGSRMCINLLKNKNYVWYNCNWSYHLVKLTIIHCHSPRLICVLHQPNRQAGWRWDGNHHPCIFQDLDGGTHLLNPCRNEVLFYLLCSEVEAVLGTSLGPFHHDSVHSTDQRTNMGILPVVQYVYSNYASHNWRNNHSMGYVTTGLTMVGFKLKFDLRKLLLWMVDYSGILDLLEKVSVQSQCPV